MSPKNWLAALAILLGSPLAASAGVIGNCFVGGGPDGFSGGPGNCALPGAGGGDEGQAYVGLTFDLGSPTAAPKLLLGWRKAAARSEGRFDGIDANLSIGLFDGSGPSALRLSYVAGKYDIFGAAGLGYSFAKGRPFASASLNVTHLRAGADYFWQDGSFEPFAEIVSLPAPAFSPCGSGQIFIDAGKADVPRDDKYEIGPGSLAYFSPALTTCFAPLAIGGA